MARTLRRPLGAPLPVLLAIFALLVIASTSAAAAPQKVEIGKARLATPSNGRAALLVPVHYPIHMLGRRGELRLALHGAGHKSKIRHWKTRPLLSGGPRRSPERRRGFTFVHRIDLSPAVAGKLQHSDRVQVRLQARAVLDIEGDGKAELRSIDTERHHLAKASDGLCAAVPVLRVRPGERAAVKLPLCGGRVMWRIATRPAHGSTRIRKGKLIYRAPKGRRGSETIVLRVGGRNGSSKASASAAVEAPVQVILGAPKRPSVRAIGDSVTAGFGYYESGEEMSLFQLDDCKPGQPYDDACSSNSIVRSNEVQSVEYSADYGLGNNVSWAAQWANEYGVTDYRNYAVSGSEPVDWLPGGALRATTEQLIAEDPDYIVMTLGANPILSDMLFGAENLACGLFTGEAEWPGCVDKTFAEVELGQNLRAFYEELIEKTSSTIYVMQYHLSTPAAALYSAWQIAVMGKMMNEEVENAVEFADPSGNRVKTFKPPHFNVGVSIEPAYPSTYSCGEIFDYEVDGPSVQANVAQAELHLDHPLSFCGGPVEGPPWVIGGDTGIHPSATGYGQMMSVLPAPR
jgi:hypothetical protein